MRSVVPLTVLTVCCLTAVSASALSERRESTAADVPERTDRTTPALVGGRTEDERADELWVSYEF